MIFLFNFDKVNIKLYNILYIGIFLFYIYNPLELVSADIEPGWNGTYVLKIKNDADYAVAYKIVWRDVFNDFTSKNKIYYEVKRG